MAGYERKPTLYQLRFDDEPGFEVAAKSASVDFLLGIVELAGELTALGDLSDMDTEQVSSARKKIRALFETFSRVLVSWNLTKDGQPVPLTADSLVTEDLDFTLKIVMTWVGAVSSVDTPLPSGSNGGPPSGLEQSLPMAPLSPSPAS